MKKVQEDSAWNDRPNINFELTTQEHLITDFFSSDLIKYIHFTPKNLKERIIELAPIKLHVCYSTIPTPWSSKITKSSENPSSP